MIDFLDRLPYEIKLLIAIGVVVAFLLACIALLFGNRLKKADIEVSKDKIKLSIETFLAKNQLVSQGNMPLSTLKRQGAAKNNRVSEAVFPSTSEQKRLWFLLQSLWDTSIPIEFIDKTPSVSLDRITFLQPQLIKTLTRENEFPVDFYFKGKVILGVGDTTNEETMNLLITCENADKIKSDKDYFIQLQNKIINLIQRCGESYKFWVVYMGNKEFSYFASTHRRIAKLSQKEAMYLTAIRYGSDEARFPENHVSKFSDYGIYFSDEIDISEIETLVQINKKLNSLDNVSV